MAERFAGKVVLVTGAGSGIGAAVARTVAAERGSVLCADRDGEAAQSTATQLQREGAVAEAIQVDVASAESVSTMAAALAGGPGRVDALVNCAGIVRYGSAIDTEVGAWDEVMGVNLRGPWLCSRAVLPGMVDAGAGAIVNLASIAALVGNPGRACYAASKAGLLGLTRQMAADFGPSGVRVNAICPGTVSTPLSRAKYVAAGLADEEIDAEMAALGRGNPLGRIGTTADVALLAAFLASDEASWITGCTYVVDGGATASVRWTQSP